MAGKGDVINEIAEQARISKKEAAAAFDAFVGYISSTCQSGERCAIPGLGSFAVSQRKAREGRNPRTNEKITIPASKNVRFNADKDRREAVNTKRGKKPCPVCAARKTDPPVAGRFHFATVNSDPEPPE